LRAFGRTPRLSLLFRLGDALMLSLTRHQFLSPALVLCTTTLEFLVPVPRALSSASLRFDAPSLLGKPVDFQVSPPEPPGPGPPGLAADERPRYPLALPIEDLG